MIAATVGPPGAAEVATLVLTISVAVERELLRAAGSASTKQLVAVLGVVLAALLAPTAALLGVRLWGLM